MRERASVIMPRRSTTSLITILTIILATDVGVLCFVVGRPSQSQTKLSRPTTTAVFGPTSNKKMPKTILSVVGDVTEPEENRDNEQEAKTTYIRGGGVPTNAVSIWPSFDALDDRLMKIALPCMLNFAINPLIGAVDLFWVNRMGNALAVAGQSAANQVFNSAFWLASFLPSGENIVSNRICLSIARASVQTDVKQVLKLTQPFLSSLKKHSNRHISLERKCQG